MYDVEHKELFAGIRAGKIINNGDYMSYSTLLAIMGREACYTGQKITWDEALKSQRRISRPRSTNGATSLSRKCSARRDEDRLSVQHPRHKAETEISRWGAEPLRDDLR